ncbi:XIAP-associated factor 1 [Varanus komodoensis]|nr:XIAP-associated factor 1 [Varanus komodoensis]
MKVKAGEPGGAMEEPRCLCENCKREVAAANFSLHEAHCRRFLTICLQCEELVALKDMEKHVEEAHRQVRCQLCHQLLQQYLLESHEAEDCPARVSRCHFCELELPHNKLPGHLDACGSRTTLCKDCGKYVMNRVLECHKVKCLASDLLRRDPAAQNNLCQQCGQWFPDEQYLHHLNTCTPLPQLLETLSTSYPTKHSPPPLKTLPPPTLDTAAEKDVQPRRKNHEPPHLVRHSLKTPKSKKGATHLAFTSTLTSAEPQCLDSTDYDQLASCSHCNILLPRPTLQKHQESRRKQPPEKPAGSNTSLWPRASSPVLSWPCMGLALPH